MIGFLSSGSPRAFAGFVEAFRQGLTDQGFVEGQNVLIDYRWAEGRYHELDPLAADLVRRQVDVLAATGGLVSAHAAKRATTTIPVLFVAGYDPVKIGLVTSVSRPEGNLTGVSIITTELAAKRLELLTELVPGTRSLAILVNPQGITTDIETNDTMAAAQDLKQTLLVFKASNDREIEAAFASAVLQQARALLVSADPLFTSRRAQIVALAARNKLAASYPFRNYVEGGGLMSYGTELAWAYRHVGDYAGRIIKGADRESSGGNAYEISACD